MAYIQAVPGQVGVVDLGVPVVMVGQAPSQRRKAVDEECVAGYPGFIEGGGEEWVGRLLAETVQLAPAEQ